MLCMPHSSTYIGSMTLTLMTLNLMTFNMMTLTVETLNKMTYGIILGVDTHHLCVSLSDTRWR